MEQFLFSLVNFCLSIRPFLEILSILVASIFVVSGITDLFFDLYFFYYSVRRFFLSRKRPKITLMRLQAREQQKIAVCIACWKEADVIGHTLINAVNNLQYRNYDIFVGTYPNDPETQKQVDQVAKENSHIHKVVTPFPGPTTKPSNLNSIYQAIKEYEKQTGQLYEIIMTQDSEDFMHPYSLLVVNHLIPRKDMVQLPVFPLEVPLNEFTHWSYADEFAENHTKLLLVRELTGGFVPAAGVGAAFTRRSFEWFFENQNQVFSTDTLTEDYELGLRFRLEGFKAAFVLINLPLPTNLEGENKDSMRWVATRSYFPRKFWQAVRQKTRWNIGIVMQSWKNIGWQGDRAIRWNLIMDRKAIVSTPTNFLAYLVFLYFVLYQLLQRFYAQYMPLLILKGSLLWYLVVIATFFMFWRMAHRAYAVNKIYGFWPALISIPRSVWGNLINFTAIVRAIAQFYSSQTRGKNIVWDKTTHQAPLSGQNNHTHDEHHEDDASALTKESGGLKDQERKKEAVNRFHENIRGKDEENRLAAIQAIDKDSGLDLYPALKKLIKDPSWRIRAEVCSTFGFLQMPESLLILKKAAMDRDWTVRSNAVRAISKMGSKGEGLLFQIIKGKDRYAREAAVAIIEQRGFLENYIFLLESKNPGEVRSAVRNLTDMVKYGDSRLARRALQKFKHE